VFASLTARADFGDLSLPRFRDSPALCVVPLGAGSEFLPDEQARLGTLEELWGIDETAPMKLLCLLLSALVASIPAGVGPSEAAPIEQAASSAEASGSVRQQAVAGGARAGKAFTKKQKQVTKEKNAQKNDGTTRCENCDTETVPGKKHEKGVTPPLNETQVDHKIPRSKGGPGEEDNAQVLCRDCNLKKGDKDPTPEEAQ